MSTNAIQLTKDFSAAEFACHDGSPTPPSLIVNLELLATNLQVIRDFFDKPIIVLSGYRSYPWNQEVKGAPHSQHLVGKAADIICPAISIPALYAGIGKLVKEGKIKEGGLGLYDTWVHYDVRGTKARWNLSEKFKSIN